VTRLGAAESDMEAVSLWVHLDPGHGRPSPFSAEEIAVYGETAGERRISARLRHPSPPDAPSAVAWTFRASECDVAQHINNAAYWTVLEEELLRSEQPEPKAIDVEMEFRIPAQPGQKTVLTAGRRRWIIDSDGSVHASILVADGQYLQ
jgi:acyl-ACP thioesterase